MDNGIYGLTKGQTSPTTPHNFKTKSSYWGNPETPFDPTVLAISFNASFVARVFSGNVNMFKDVLEKAIKNRGFSFIHVLSPCVTYRGRDLFKFYRENTIEVDENYNPLDKVRAFEIANRQDKIATGILYRNERPTLSDEFQRLIDVAQKDGLMTEEDLLNVFLPK